MVGRGAATFENIVLTVSALADFNGQPGGGAPSTCRADQDDTLADFSNWGPDIEIAAPGVCILSTYPIEQGEYGTISGTSMASPHVPGALALLASTNNPNTKSNVYALYSTVIAKGNFDWVDDSGDGIKEPLLDVSTFVPTLIAGPGGGGSGSDTTSPVVTITSPAHGTTFATGASITFTGSANDDIDGDLTSSLVWTSNNGVEIGRGGSFSPPCRTARTPSRHW